MPTFYGTPNLSETLLNLANRTGKEYDVNVLNPLRAQQTQLANQEAAYRIGRNPIEDAQKDWLAKKQQEDYLDTLAQRKAMADFAQAYRTSGDLKAAMTSVPDLRLNVDQVRLLEEEDIKKKERERKTAIEAQQRTAAGNLAEGMVPIPSAPTVPVDGGQMVPLSALRSGTTQTAYDTNVANARSVAEAFPSEIVKSYLDMNEQGKKDAALLERARTLQGGKMAKPAQTSKDERMTEVILDEMFGPEDSEAKRAERAKMYSETRFRQLNGEPPLIMKYRMQIRQALSHGDTELAASLNQALNDTAAKLGLVQTQIFNSETGQTDIVFMNASDVRRQMAPSTAVAQPGVSQGYTPGPSKGAPQIPAAELAKMGQSEAVKNNIADIRNFITDKRKEGWEPDTGLGEAVNQYLDMTDTLGDPNRAQLRQKLKNLISVVYSESGAAINEQEMKDWLTRLPTMYTPSSQFENRMANAEQYLNNLVASKIKILGEAGYRKLKADKSDASLAAYLRHYEDINKQGAPASKQPSGAVKFRGWK